MRTAGGVKLGGKRRPITRRDRTRDWRRGRRRRVWIGSRQRGTTARPFFFGSTAQHMESVRPADFFGAAAMLLAMVSWGMLAALLAG